MTGTPIIQPKKYLPIAILLIYGISNGKTRNQCRLGESFDESPAD